MIDLNKKVWFSKKISNLKRDGQTLCMRLALTSSLKKNKA